MPLDPPGICDRCGQRYLLKELKDETILGRSKHNRVCPYCWDVEHPQLDTRNVRTNDKQQVDDPRSDSAELTASRTLTDDPTYGSFEDWLGILD